MHSVHLLIFFYISVPRPSQSLYALIYTLTNSSCPVPFCLWPVDGFLNLTDVFSRREKVTFSSALSETSYGEISPGYLMSRIEFSRTPGQSSLKPNKIGTNRISTWRSVGALQVEAVRFSDTHHNLRFVVADKIEIWIFANVTRGGLKKNIERAHEPSVTCWCRAVLLAQHYTLYVGVVVLILGVPRKAWSNTAGPCFLLSPCTVHGLYFVPEKTIKKVTTITYFSINDTANIDVRYLCVTS